MGKVPLAPEMHPVPVHRAREGGKGVGGPWFAPAVLTVTREPLAGCAPPPPPPPRTHHASGLADAGSGLLEQPPLESCENLSLPFVLFEFLKQHLEKFSVHERQKVL